MFAYGQTGSGKTFTMMGIPSDTGLIPRLCRNMFDRIDANTEGDVSFRVEVSYLEIYNEKVKDLLCAGAKASQTNLKVREHKVLGPYVEGLTKVAVSSADDIQATWRRG